MFISSLTSSEISNKGQMINDLYICPDILERICIKTWTYISIPIHSSYQTKFYLHHGFSFSLILYHIHILTPINQTELYHLDYPKVKLYNRILKVHAYAQPPSHREVVRSFPIIPSIYLHTTAAVWRSDGTNSIDIITPSQWDIKWGRRPRPEILGAWNDVPPEFDDMASMTLKDDFS